METFLSEEKQQSHLISDLGRKMKLDFNFFNDVHGVHGVGQVGAVASDRGCKWRLSYVQFCNKERKKKCTEFSLVTQIIPLKGTFHSLFPKCNFKEVKENLNFRAETYHLGIELLRDPRDIGIKIRVQCYCLGKYRRIYRDL